MYAIMNILNNQYVVGKQKERPSSFTDKTYPARCVLKEIGFSTHFGNDVNRFRSSVQSNITMEAQGTQQRILSKSDDELLERYLHITPLMFVSEEEAEQFLIEYPPRPESLKEYLVIVEV